MVSVNEEDSRVIFILEKELQDKISGLLKKIPEGTKSSILRECVRAGFPLIEKKYKGMKKTCRKAV